MEGSWRVSAAVECIKSNTYFAKPLALSPLVCAAFWWVSFSFGLLKLYYGGSPILVHRSKSLLIFQRAGGKDALALSSPPNIKSNCVLNILGIPEFIGIERYWATHGPTPKFPWWKNSMLHFHHFQIGKYREGHHKMSPSQMFRNNLHSLPPSQSQRRIFTTDYATNIWTCWCLLILKDTPIDHSRVDGQKWCTRVDLRQHIVTNQSEQRLSQ